MAAVASLSRHRFTGAAAGAQGARLRERLVAAGPLAAAFGIDLASRVDLFAGVDCLRLLEIPDQGPPSSPDRVTALIERELGAPLEELFETFEAEPFDSALLGQRHRARLPGGEAVAVELLHPELSAALDVELGAPSGGGGLGALVETLIAGGELPAVARSAVEPFAARLDLRRGAAALAELAEETRRSRWVEVPTVHLRLCSRRVRVLSAVRGRLAEPAAAGGDAPAPAIGRARRLSRVWLALALGGRLFPLQPWARNVAYLSGGRLAFVGGDVHRLPGSALSGLREYLAAVAAREPARAAQALCDLLPEGRGDRRLRDRLRHTDPFRDHGWDVGGDLFVRQVLAHWRTAARLGHQLPKGVAPLYRGLFLLGQEAGRLAGDATAVRDGLREARLLLLVAELGEGVQGGRWAGDFERQLDRLAAVPRKLDRILTLAARDERPAASGSSRRAGREAPRRSAWPAVAGCLLALSAVVLLTHHVAAAGTFAAAEPLGAILVLLLGGLTLWVSGTSGGG